MSTKHVHRHRAGPQRGSFNARLAEMKVGEYTYVETTQDAWKQVMIRGHDQSRFPKGMEDYKFQTEVFTAVSSVAGSVKVLVRIERVA